ncbi:hypothetical protein [Nocardia asteroides]|uniref:hypothetical protein n=1 Tax=Nocardia asteroides TaxID=1824 RepID=UPI001E5C7B06|nr:hypothetical protein [Nocardia asteroides]UGT63357.1 hypothetical protein LTT61_08620 [Nocardia asteroides]
MVLNVDIDELVRTAAALAALAREAGGAIPGGWVVPAGADPISATAVPRLNGQTATLLNELGGLLGEIQRTASKVGAAAVDYTATDADGSRALGGSGGEQAVNPVPEIVPLPIRLPPPVGGVPDATVDPLTFARALHAGPGPGRAAEFAGTVRNFAGTLLAGTAPGMTAAAGVLQGWTPVGATASTELLGQHGRLTGLGARLGTLADGIDSYGTAFRLAKAKHPTPQEIMAARRKLLAALRSKDPVGTELALAEFQEQNARSAETITGYTGAVESGVGAGQAAAGAGADEGAGQGDSSMLSAMLPALMSAMSGMNGLQGDDGYDDIGYDDDYGYDDIGYDDYGIPSFTGAGPGSPGAPGGMPSVDAGIPADTAFAVGAMPMVSGTGTAPSTAGLPRASVIEPLGAGSQAGANGSRAGSPYMPYMPMSPGMGGGQGGGGGDRNRVVAWHPDRLMYVDDTPHTDPVIGERPSIAPTVTPPTPAPPTQHPSSGGTA